MKLNLLVRLVALTALLACGLPASLAAQQTESRIVGRVVDESKAALPGVTVTVTSKQTGAIRTVVTDAEGAYVVTNLGPGGTQCGSSCQVFRLRPATWSSALEKSRLPTLPWESV